MLNTSESTIKDNESFVKSNLKLCLDYRSTYTYIYVTSIY